MADSVAVLRTLIVDDEKLARRGLNIRLKDSQDDLIRANTKQKAGEETPAFAILNLVREFN